MEEHFFFNLKLKEYAELSGRSLPTFNRDFIKTYGTTPGGWLKNKRLNYAKYLLNHVSGIHLKRGNNGYECPRCRKVHK